MLYGPDESGALKLVTAHCGDTRAVLGRRGKAFQLTDDHKPNDPDEKKRVTQAGGNVMQLYGIWRVTQQLRRPTNGIPAGTMGLAVSRAIGDLLWKEPKKIVSPDPTVTVYDVDFEEDEFMIICSDGIFDVITNDEVVKFTRPFVKEDPKTACQILVDMANKRGSMDDKTVQIVRFNWCEIPDGLAVDPQVKILLEKKDDKNQKASPSPPRAMAPVVDSDDEEDEIPDGEEGPSWTFFF